MKRWRCPDCGAVHTARPHEYGPGIQYSIAAQQESLQAKLAGKPFLPSLPRQVQQHWRRIFQELCRAEANWIAPDHELQLLAAFGQTGITKRRIHRESIPSAEPPYLPFALTVRPAAFNLE